MKHIPEDKMREFLYDKFGDEENWQVEFEFFLKEKGVELVGVAVKMGVYS